MGAVIFALAPDGDGVIKSMVSGAINLLAPSLYLYIECELKSRELIT